MPHISRFLPPKSDRGERTAVAAPGIKGRLSSRRAISSPTPGDAEGEHFAITNRMPREAELTSLAVAGATCLVFDWRAIGRPFVLLAPRQVCQVAILTLPA